MATIKQLAARVLLCGALGLAACGLADGVAAAAPAPSVLGWDREGEV